MLQSIEAYLLPVTEGDRLFLSQGGLDADDFCVVGLPILHERSQFAVLESPSGARTITFEVVIPPGLFQAVSSSMLSVVTEKSVQAEVRAIFAGTLPRVLLYVRRDVATPLVVSTSAAIQQAHAMAKGEGDDGAEG